MTAKEFKTDFRLDGKVALVTGGHSGIGLATAKLFMEKGAQVCACCHHEHQIEAAQKELPGALIVPVDLGQPDTINNAVDKAVEKFGHIDVLFNCAGVGLLDWAEDMSLEMWQTVINVNLTGTFLMSQRVGREMIRQGNGGKIISVASEAGVITLDQHVAYAASKAGIISMTQSLALEWGKYGIQVNALSPGVTETQIIAGFWDQEGVAEEALKNIPVGRFNQPEEIGLAAVFFASDASNVITGTNMLIDGGFTIH